jgi:hypothetical protein
MAAEAGIALLPAMGLLAVWCALGATGNVVRLAATGGILVLWRESLRLNNSGYQPETVLLGFMFLLPTMFTLRLFGWKIRMNGQSTSATSGAASPLRPQMSLGNLVELVTAAGLMMAANRYLGLHQLRSDPSFFVAWFLLGLVVASAVWFVLATANIWLRAIAAIVLPLSLATVPLLRREFGWSLWIVAYAPFVIVAAVSSGYRLLGYRLVRKIEPAQPTFIQETPLSTSTAAAGAITSTVRPPASEVAEDS